MRIADLLTTRPERVRRDQERRIIRASKDIPLHKLTVAEFMELLDVWGIAGWGSPDHVRDALENRIEDIKATI